MLPIASWSSCSVTLRSLLTGARQNAANGARQILWLGYFDGLAFSPLLWSGRWRQVAAAGRSGVLAADRKQLFAGYTGQGPQKGKGCTRVPGKGASIHGTVRMILEIEERRRLQRRDSFEAVTDAPASMGA